MNRALATTIPVLSNAALIVYAINRGLAKSGNPGRYFGEGRFTTIISCAQLLLIALFAGLTFLARRKLTPGRSIFSGPALWAFIAAGFVFLAADDAFEIHEHFDIVIHQIFHLQETPLTDRIDDALIALYGVIGCAFLWFYRHEFLAFKFILPPLIGGFICLALSVLCDTISNDATWLRWYAQDAPIPPQLNGWFSAGDGAFTLLGEASFIAAFYLAFRQSVARTSTSPPI
jgi:hypothetical protein